MYRRYLFLLVILLSVLSFAGCTSAGRSKISGYGKDFNIVLYSGGVKIGEWDSVGKVHNEADSDGKYFKDKKTGKLVEISGHYIITPIN